MKNIRFLSALALLFGTNLLQSAGAVCLDPITLVSGYRVPLDSEIRSSQAIVVGKVIKTLPLQEDRDDPDGISAHLYTVQVLRQLKGSIPATIVVKIENDSGRYHMSNGETHLLFFNISGGVLDINSCGNSSQLPQGDDVLMRVEVQLGPTSVPLTLY